MAIMAADGDRLVGRLAEIKPHLYTIGVRSSRKLEAACVDVVAFRWLAAGHAPDYRSIARFRKRHLSACPSGSRAVRLGRRTDRERTPSVTRTYQLN